MRRASKDPGVLRRLPKVEVHVHLDGALRPSLALELARQQASPLAAKTEEEISRLVVVSKSKGSLKEVLDVFFILYPILKTPQAIERTAYELCRDAKANGILYFETRFAPLLLQTKRYSMEDMLEAAIGGLRLGSQDFGVGSGVIVTMLRDHSMRGNEAMCAAAIGFKDRGVVGLDLANHEAVSSLLDYADFYKEAKRQGLGTTAHVGEIYPSPDLAVALDLNIDRIGHGVFLPKYPDLLQEVAQRKIPIEISLTSNLRTAAVRSYREHPLAQFLEQGIPVVLNTDDPGVFGIDLTHEYEVAAKEVGLNFLELKRLAAGGIDALFLPEEKKKILRRRFEASLAA